MNTNETTNEPTPGGGDSKVENSQNGRPDSQNALRTLIYGMIIGVLAIILYALNTQTASQFLEILTVCIMVAGASLLVGGVIGFLFGIPRTLQQQSNPDDDETSSAAASIRTQYMSNTNLEQISDWLTKILVGVGLTQLTAIPGKLQSISAYFAEGMGGQRSDEVFVLGLLIFSFVIGFLFGYLWTRLFLAGELRKADQSALGLLVTEMKSVKDESEQTGREFAQFKKQSELDAAALNMAHQQLNPSPDLPKVTQEELNAAIASASRPIRVQIFQNAWKIRGDNWRTETTKPRMESTIPIFRGLIENDIDNRYHMNHGQLGFALKDMIKPEWKEAHKELSTAIDLRGPWSEKGWLFYEFNRAICKIELDDAFRQDIPSDAETRLEILADLDAAAHADDLIEKLKSDHTISKWAMINKIDLDKLDNYI